MLEQPPERSQWEVEAEAAAAAQASPQRRMHGCLRLLIWCMPTLLFYGVYAAVAYISIAVFRGVGDTLWIPVILMVILGLTYGVGFFDGCFSTNSIQASPEQRKRDLLWHAAKFTAWQVLLIPALSVLMIGACFIIFSSVNF
jgi:hypothetical protein